jgi:hypothetical protein
LVYLAQQARRFCEVRFVEALGYPGVVAAFDSPARRARLADRRRRPGIAEPRPMPTAPRRYVAL